MTVDLQDGKLTLGELLHRTASRVPDNIALLWEKTRITYGELDAMVNRVANGFVDAGITPGEPVGLLVNKRPELVITFLACARMGAVATPINFKLTADRIRYQFKHIEMKAVIVDPDLMKIYNDINDLLPEPRKVIFLSDKPSPRHNSWAELLDFTDSEPSHQARSEDLVFLNYTSGSTGMPKGALTTHKNIMWNCLSNLETFEMYEDDVFLGMFSTFSHPHELFHRSLYLGCSAVLCDSLNPRIVGRAIQEHRVTWMMAVPSFYEMMYSQAKDSTDLGSLRMLEAGGSFMDAQTLLDMEKRFKTTMMPVWGSTETTGVGIALLPGPDRKPGTLGKACAFYEFKIVREDGKEAAPDEVGELAVRGPAVISGYINMPKDPERFRDGWYHTQDLMTRDADGFFRFVARSSEMIKVGGIRVYPVEIEEVIKTHPDVKAVVVVRADDRLRGEMARAIVVVRPGASLTERALRAYCRKKLAVYQVPRLIEFWDEIPKLPNGKIDKKAIVASYQTKDD